LASELEKEKKLINGVRVPCEKSIEDLKLMLSKEMSYFLPACYALSDKGTDETLEILKEQLFSSDWCKRRAAVEAIAYHPKGHFLSNELIILLSDKSIYVVHAAYSTLARLKIHEAHDKIVELLNSKDDYKRKIAISSLGELYEENDISILIKLYLTDRSKQVKDEAAWTLKKICDSTNWKAIYIVLKTGFLPRHRLWACEQIEKYGDGSYTEDLKMMLEDKDGHVRHKAFRILQKFTLDC
jgi:HEAT repeat protein